VVVGTADRPFLVDRADGARIGDGDGWAFIDLVGGVAAANPARTNPEIVAAWPRSWTRSSPDASVAWLRRREHPTTSRFTKRRVDMNDDGTDDQVRMAVDRDSCIGAGQCEMNDEDVFELDDDVLVTVIGDGTLPRDRAVAAADRCPGRAISFVELDGA